MARSQSGNLSLGTFSKGWCLFSCLANTLHLVSQAQDNSWVTDHPEFPSKFECPHGYVDRTQGKAKYWACATGCPGGPFADAPHCECACVLPHELQNKVFRGKTSSTTPMRGITSAAPSTTPPSASGQAGAGGQQSSRTGSSGSSSSSSSTGTGVSNVNGGASATPPGNNRVFRTVLTTLPPGGTNLRIAPKSATEEADEEGGLSGMAVFVIVISSLVVLGTCMLMLTVNYMGNKQPARRTLPVMRTPTINKANLACAPVTDFAILDPRGPRKAWEGSTLALDCAVKEIEKMSDASTRQPSPSPSERSIAVSREWSRTSSAVTSVLTVSTSTPPRDTRHSNLRTAPSVDFVSWQRAVYQQQPPAQRAQVLAVGVQPAAADQLYSPQCMVQYPDQDGQLVALAEQQPVQYSSKHSHSKSSKAQPIRQQRSRRGSDMRSAQHSHLRNSQRVDLHSRHVSPPSVQNVCLSKPGQPPTEVHSSNGHDSSNAQNANNCTPPDSNSPTPTAHTPAAPSWRDAFKGENSNSAVSKPAKTGSPSDSEA
mmetsp:Transcript_113356/g.201006  ORF Transcript_113356/g.201006 Transcript_113356/m.201006 type:complete len:540 (-) Transcript_113356:179-1798(-)